MHTHTETIRSMRTVATHGENNLSTLVTIRLVLHNAYGLYFFFYLLLSTSLLVFYIIIITGAVEIEENKNETHKLLYKRNGSQQQRSKKKCLSCCYCCTDDNIDRHRMTTIYVWTCCAQHCLHSRTLGAQTHWQLKILRQNTRKIQVKIIRN